MADNKTRGHTADRKRLNMSEPYEVAYAKSNRASPERKAMLAKSAAKRSAKSAAKKTSGSSARKSTASRAGKSPAMKRTDAAPTKPRTPTKRGTPHPPKAEKTVENTAPKTMREPDAVDFLTDDHLAVGALFKRYERLARRAAVADERRALAAQICEMLTVHTKLEEDLFYPAARAGGIDSDQLDEAKVEHATARDLIAQIEAGDPDDDLYDAKVTVLREYIQHHVVEEQTEMFPKCRRSKMDLVALRGELEARKMSLEPLEAASTAAGGTKEEPGLLTRLSDKLFSSDDRGAGASDARG